MQKDVQACLLDLGGCCLASVSNKLLYNEVRLNRPSADMYFQCKGCFVFYGVQGQN